MFDFRKRKKKAAAQPQPQPRPQPQPQTHTIRIPKHDEILVDYSQSRSGFDNCFSFLEGRDFFPPAANFASLMRESEREISDLIWYLCLLYKAGMITREGAAGFGTVYETAHYPFECGGVPVTLIYDFRYQMIDHFAVDPAFADRREEVVQTLCDCIRKDGSSITYADWVPLRGV